MATFYFYGDAVYQPIINLNVSVVSQSGMQNTIRWSVSSGGLKSTQSGVRVSSYTLGDVSVYCNDGYVGKATKGNGSGTFTVTRDTATNTATLGFTLRMGYSTWELYYYYDDPSYYEDKSGYPTSNDYFSYTVESSTVSGTGATINSAPDFTDEDSPTITYSYDKGTSVVSAKLEACISFTGATDDIPYREIDVNGSSYTFELTATERSKFWTLLDAGTTATVRFYLKTTETLDTGEILPIYSYVTKSLRFVNYEPVLTPVIEDINSDTLALTGDKYTMVRHFSTAYFNTQAVARKGATIASQEVRNGDITVSNTSTGQIENITSNTFYVSATDNRGHSTNDAVIFNNLSDLKFIDYAKLTCSVKPEPITGTGDLVINLSGKFFEESFGAATNKFTVDYDCHLQGYEANWQTLGFVTPNSGNDHNYTYSFTVSGLDYKSAYQLQIKVSDELMSYTTPITVVVSEPIFDWDKDDFAFHIPVQMDKGFSYPQTVLWSGSAQMGDGEVIELDYPISSQPTGIVLVFSLYRNGVAENASITTFFKSRAEVQYLMPTGKHTFLMAINSNLSVFGCKYLTITDTTITGFEGNTNSGTASGSGITFNNSSFVLRYVIGV